MPEPPVTYNDFHPLADSEEYLNFRNVQDWFNFEESIQDWKRTSWEGSVSPTYRCFIPGEGRFIWMRGGSFQGMLSWDDNAVWTTRHVPGLPEVDDA